MDTCDWRDQMEPGSRQRHVSQIIDTLKRHQPVSDQDELLELQKSAQRFEETTYATAASQYDYLQKILMKMLLMEGASDWRGQLHPDSRQRIVNKIMDTLKPHLPVCGQEGLHELQEIAQRFENRIFIGATSRFDYLRKISLKMLTMETKPRNAMANTVPPNAGGPSNKPPHPGASAWRGQLHPDSRQRIVNKICFAKEIAITVLSVSLGCPQDQFLNTNLEVLKKEGKQGLFRNVPSLQALGVFSWRMTSQFSNRNPLIFRLQGMDGDVTSNMKRSIFNIHSTIKNKNRKRMDTLKRHLPVSSEDGLRELRKIAQRFEDKIFIAATSQSDYLRRISLKMLTMENKSQNSMANTVPPNARGPSNRPPDPGLAMQSQDHSQEQPVISMMEVSNKRRRASSRRKH